MKCVTFSAEFDAGFWPGPLTDLEAVAGETWVGQNGLLSLLETTLGLRYPAEPDALRAAALVPTIQKQNGFWSESAKVDPFGTARKLLTWRDRLCLHGWQGQPVTPLLKSLAQVTKSVLPGFPDRLNDVFQTLSKRRADMARVSLCEPLDELPLAWRQVLKALQAQGTKVEVMEPGAATPSGDLEAARKPGFKPTGDGSLQLLRPAGPLAAAHEVAAWLAARGDLNGTVIIGGDAVLDRELRNFGLPCLGSPSSVYDHTLLQVVPLVLEMGWSPPDPQRALELLTLPQGPVPRGIAFRLTNALQEWPAVGSDVWQKALAEGLEKLPDPESRSRVRKRLELLFSQADQKGRYPVRSIEERLTVLENWARGRAKLGDEEQALLEPVLRQLSNLMRLLDLSGVSDLSPAQLQRAIQDATAEVGLPALNQAQAGMASVGTPGSIVGRAKVIVWWNFHRGSEARPHQLPLNSNERKELREAGVEIPEPGDEALALAQAWQRPLLMAEEILLLVCPARGEDGEELATHPLWDEVLARAEKGADTSLLEMAQPIGAPKRSKRHLVELPGPVPIWHAPKGATLRREQEWPASLERLVSCPFRWVIEDLAYIRGGSTASLQSGSFLEGQFMHEVLARLLETLPAEPQQAECQALEIFDRDGPLLAAPIFQPGKEDVKARTRRAVGVAAKRLVEMLSAAGLKPSAMETRYSRKVPELDFELHGIPDLVAGHAVIDFKRGGSRRWREKLENGTATQMACYAHLCQDKRSNNLPACGVFIIREAAMLTTDQGIFPSAEGLKGPSIEQTWEALVSAVNQRFIEIDAGIIHAPGAGEAPPKKSTIDESGMVLISSCGYCNAAGLCGRGRGA
ncbi:hypothetical protein AAU61_09900 [Desulfocarbo indianensis]|nr:hypothetical protein AAU61_09900 [Desulfocarbo indianensis]